MATTFVFESYFGSSPAWTTLNSTYQLIGFYGNAFDDKVAITSYQSSTHISGATAGVDGCTGNHVPNVKYVSTNQFDNGSGTQTLNDTNLINTECTLRAYLHTDAGVVTQNGRFYCYNGGGDVTIFAANIQVYAFERGITGGNWTSINNGSSTGGDNNGQRLNLNDHTSTTDHYWYVAVSCKPLSVGAKTSFSFGSTVEYY